MSETLKIINESSTKDLLTKADLQLLEARIDGELKLLKWMVGIMLAGVVSLVMKAFFM
ncbi:MAG: hypothetical protein SFH39_03600 [Candidatus Magnetobacterium sp. LHC-1]